MNLLGVTQFAREDPVVAGFSLPLRPGMVGWKACYHHEKRSNCVTPISISLYVLCVKSGKD